MQPHRSFRPARRLSPAPKEPSFFAATLVVKLEHGVWSVLCVTSSRFLNEAKLPGGTGLIKHSETPKECAVRELEQETGYLATEIELAYEVQVSDNHTQYFFLATQWNKDRDVESRPIPELVSSRFDFSGALWHREADDDDVTSRFETLEVFWSNCFFKHKVGFVRALNAHRLTLPARSEDRESLEHAIQRLGIH